MITARIMIARKELKRERRGKITYSLASFFDIWMTSSESQ
jgi:hypothetical protein